MQTRTVERRKQYERAETSERENKDEKRKIKTKAEVFKYNMNMQSYVEINENQNRKEANNIRNETQGITTLEQYQTTGGE